MLHGVHQRPPPSANRANTIRVTTGERPRTVMNEPKTEPRLRPGLLSRCGGRVAGRSSAACAAVTGRRFVIHGSQIASVADSERPPVVPIARVLARRSGYGTRLMGGAAGGVVAILDPPRARVGATGELANRHRLGPRRPGWRLHRRPAPIPPEPAAGSQQPGGVTEMNPSSWAPGANSGWSGGTVITSGNSQGALLAFAP